MTKNIFLPAYILLLIISLFAFSNKNNSEDKIISYTVDLNKSNIKLYWKDDKGNILKSIQNLKDYLNKKRISLLFAGNAGMYKQDNSPQGLFIQERKELRPIDTASGNGNFHMKPKGIFYITTSNQAVVCETKKFTYTEKINYATQSGPMLVIDGNIHNAFKQRSTNLNIRNGVGILPDGKVIFAMSKEKISCYDFADYFKQLGCQQALYLDGFVSRTYLPEKNWVQTDGNFGVMIGVTEKK
ncbi:MAG: phosphodiester glycosidase family protein [Cytophagaceae bacterium]|nr:phosphodiester glycosidase family protein [Cytophagaceae bacterium]